MFDRAILDLTYYELIYKKEMLADVNSILKTGGILVTSENIAKKPGKLRKGCGYNMPIEHKIKMSLPAGFKLKSKMENKNQDGTSVFSSFKIVTIS